MQKPCFVAFANCWGVNALTAADVITQFSFGLSLLSFNPTHARTAHRIRLCV